MDDLEPDRVVAGVAAARERIARACATVGRDPAEVEIVAAVKYLPPEGLPMLAAAGIRRVGENRTDQLIAKQEQHGDLFTWDFIGHLQSRKVRDLLGRVTLIHSLSTESTAQQIQQRATQPQEVLVEVNTAGDPSKEGVAPEGLDVFLDYIAQQASIRVRGLMTMPAYADDAELSRPAFAALAALAERARERWTGVHDFDHLSMGTSQDFEVAVEEGATLVRLGQVLLRP
jgi:pyridoxal phosphate enzyme (YggS family)